MLFKLVTELIKITDLSELRSIYSIRWQHFWINNRVRLNVSFNQYRGDLVRKKRPALTFKFSGIFKKNWFLFVVINRFGGWMSFPRRMIDWIDLLLFSLCARITTTVKRELRSSAPIADLFASSATGSFTSLANSTAISDRFPFDNYFDSNHSEQSIQRPVDCI